MRPPRCLLSLLLCCLLSGCGGQVESPAGRAGGTSTPSRASIWPCTSKRVCCAANGRWSYAKCAADGTAAACSDGMHLVGDDEQCMPAGFEARYCAELQAQACPAADWSCSPQAKGSWCDCEQGNTGQLAWSCHWLTQ